MQQRSHPSMPSRDESFSTGSLNKGGPAHQLDGSASSGVFNGSLNGSMSFSNSHQLGGGGGGNNRPKRQLSKRNKGSSSAYKKFLLWAISMTGLFIATVNYLHLLNQQGNLPTGISFSIQYGGGQDGAEQQRSELFFIGEHGGGYNNQTLPIMSDVQTSKLRFLQQLHRQQQLLHPQVPPPRGQITTTAAIPAHKEQFYAERNQKLDTHLDVMNRKRQRRAENEQANKEVQAVALKNETNQAADLRKENEDNSPLHNMSYYFHLNRREQHDKEPILRLIRGNAQIYFISEATYERLPTWSQVTSMYGDGPKIVGLDHCPKFQDDGELSEKFLAVAGMFNSGTNFLGKVLLRNCVLHHRQEKYGQQQRGIRAQVPWGKHTPPKDEEFRYNHVASKSQGVDARQVLPAVTIRDPFRWMQSMCSHAYTGKWPRPFARKDPRYHCPNLVPTIDEKEKLLNMKKGKYKPILEGDAMESETVDGKGEEDTEEKEKFESEDKEKENIDLAQEDQDIKEVKIGEQEKLSSEDLKTHYFPVSVKYSNFTRHHRSLVHLWSEWNREYVDLENHPRIISRMEDLLFFPDQVVPKLCECAGGKSTLQQVKLIAESAKKKVVRARPGEEHTGYLEAIIRYGNPHTRSRGFTAQDLQYAEHYLDQDLLELFGYKMPHDNSQT